jgi:hypothetical protein
MDTQLRRKRHAPRGDMALMQAEADDANCQTRA